MRTIAPSYKVKHTATHCNPLQHTTQHSATHLPSHDTIVGATSSEHHSAIIRNTCARHRPRMGNQAHGAAQTNSQKSAEITVEPKKLHRKILKTAQRNFLNSAKMIVEPTNSQTSAHYGVATMSRRLKIVGLFCRISCLL